MNKGNILIVDDEQNIRDILSRLLEFQNYNAFQSDSIDKALTIITEEDIQVAVLDVRLGKVNSIDHIYELKEINPFLEVIVLTAFGTISDGVKSIKLGAFDYIVKGDDDDKVIPIVEKAMEKNRLATKLYKLEEKIKSRYGFDNIIGSSDKIKEAVSLARKLSRLDTTLLLIGETGTGKEVFARAIHYESNRSSKPFVPVNCSAIPKDILESELFGYKKGAFTGANSNKKGLLEEADGGTIFLDEIGEMPFSLQAKLLRVLETNSFIKPGDSKEIKVDLRIITATNKNLEKAILDESFRKDLFYRINVFTIELPPLRDRQEDIPLLAEYFLKHFSQKQNKPINFIQNDFFAILSDLNFTGNIRELRNMCERVVILADNGRILTKNLPNSFSQASLIPHDENKDLSLSSMEKKQIQSVLAITKRNKNKAAEMLGIGLTTLYRKIEQYNLDE